MAGPGVDAEKDQLLLDMIEDSSSSSSTNSFDMVNIPAFNPFRCAPILINLAFHYVDVDRSGVRGY